MRGTPNMTIITGIITFFVGAIIGRYLEKVINFLRFMSNDLKRVRKQTTKSLNYGSKI